MCLQSTAYEGGNGGYADDGAARGCLGRHLAGCGLGGVECAVEVGSDGFRVEIWFYADWDG